MISRKTVEKKNHSLIHVRIPMALDNQLQKAQIETGQTMSKIIRQALEGSLKHL
jgi:predicted DNA-binding protein